jgi:hypothetical protein
VTRHGPHGCTGRHQPRACRLARASPAPSSIVPAPHARRSLTRQGCFADMPLRRRHSPPSAPTRTLPRVPSPKFPPTHAFALAAFLLALALAFAFPFHLSSHRPHSSTLCSKSAALGLTRRLLPLLPLKLAKRSLAYLACARISHPTAGKGRTGAAWRGRRLEERQRGPRPAKAGTEGGVARQRER